MSNYMPKVGDKVRATLGESRVEGQVAEVRYSSAVPVTAWVFPNSETFDRVELRVGGTYGWQFEQLVSVPWKFGAVIRRADGDKIVLAGCDVPDGPEWWSPESGWMFEGAATRGGFTVLFDGVDE